MTDDPGSRRYLVPVSREGGDWDSGLPDAAALATRAVTAALERTLSDDAGGPLEVSLLLADDVVLRRLNRDYRGRDAATNVLAFPNMDPHAPRPADAVLALGDLAVALETLLREAAAQGKTPEHHFCHLIVHGTLHLLGHDHEAEAEAQAMEALERGILGSLGIPDPYRVLEEPEPPPARETIGIG